MIAANTTASGLQKSVAESLGRLARALDEQNASEEIRRYLDTAARFHR